MKVSVITINYNNRDVLEKTINSTINQTSKDFEFIIIDGASTDGSVEAIKRHADKINYWSSESDKGIYNAMNKGIGKANGEYCIFMNSGDSFYTEDVIEDFIRLSDNRDIVCGDTWLGKLKKAPDDITFDTLYNLSICHQSAFIRTSLMKKYMYDESMKIVADRKFFLQALILENCSYKHINTIVANYDITGFSAQNRTLSDLEYKLALEQLIPQRIRIDYGRNKEGELYGDTDYDKLFVELRKRNYRKPIYTLVVYILRFISIFHKSARFIKHFPNKTN
jgi:glycosyltransferase involved in cell wall biosynthesis